MEMEFVSVFCLLGNDDSVRLGPLCGRGVGGALVRRGWLGT